MTIVEIAEIEILDTPWYSRWSGRWSGQWSGRWSARWSGSWFGRWSSLWYVRSAVRRNTSCSIQWPASFKCLVTGRASGLVFFCFPVAVSSGSHITKEPVSDRPCCRFWVAVLLRCCYSVAVLLQWSCQ